MKNITLYTEQVVFFPLVCVVAGMFQKHEKHVLQKHAVHSG